MVLPGYYLLPVRTAENWGRQRYIGSESWKISGILQGQKKLLWQDSGKGLMTIWSHQVWRTAVEDILFGNGVLFLQRVLYRVLQGDWRQSKAWDKKVWLARMKIPTHKRGVRQKKEHLSSHYLFPFMHSAWTFSVFNFFFSWLFFFFLMKRLWTEASVCI